MDYIIINKLGVLQAECPNLKVARECKKMMEDIDKKLNFNIKYIIKKRS